MNKPSCLLFIIGCLLGPLIYKNVAHAQGRQKIAAEMQHSMTTKLLKQWYPRAVDRVDGGFLSTFSYDFKPVGNQDKMIVTQARHVWSNARAAQQFPEVKYYAEGARHGYLFLKNVLWDKQYGGFHTYTDKQGNVKENNFAPKEAYGNAFALYAVAAYYQQSGDTSALSLAKRTFLWLEQHSHDPVYKGYYQHMELDGSPIKRPAGIEANVELGYKDQNTSIHLLEAFTELYKIWPDELLKTRLQEMLTLISETIVNKKGYLQLFFQPDWTPVSLKDSTAAAISKYKSIDHVSFGHDVETAYLMLEAAHVLGLKNDTAILQLGKKMVDHALVNGWDKQAGGFYDEGFYDKDKSGISILADTKNWWAQAEGLNTLLIMDHYFPKDPQNYYGKFLKLWSYTKTYLIDQEHGDWYQGGLDKQPEYKTTLKGQIWKGTYHTLRSFINCIAQLRAAANTGAAKAQSGKSGGQMTLNKLEYLEYQGVNVMLAHDFYPEGHQGGVGIIQNGQRVATNGDLRLEPTPGQWSPIPKVGKRMVDRVNSEVSVRMEYPNPEIDRKGFNPIIYPDLKFAYHIRVLPAGKSFKIIVDLDQPLPDDWVGRVGFNLELFPGILYGKSYYMDKQFGIFTPQANGQMYKSPYGESEVMPMATGKKLTIAPETGRQQMLIENLKHGDLQLLDGRAKHNNGWFVVRSLIAKGATKNAIEWLVTPHAVDGWHSDPVVQVSQVGYHPKQQKIAVIELDRNDQRRLPVSLMRVDENGGLTTVLKSAPTEWGDFLRYHYLQLDFTKVTRPGMYVVKYGAYQTEPFQISENVFKNDVWQPTLAYFMPAQMCHMRINDKYRVWHGLCHIDDARMAPIDSNHFDGYLSGHSTFTKFNPGDQVPFLNRGAWHDAGDFDLRVESQAETIHGLTLAYEQFGSNYDNTTIDQKNHVVEIQQPDGKPDVLQQIAHGLLSVTGGYKAMGRFYRGVIEPTIRQYVLLGDAANITDNKPFITGAVNTDPILNQPSAADDRWVFTEDNPARSLQTAAALAAASRVMKGFDDTLSTQCLQIAKQVWQINKDANPMWKVALATELLITTKDKEYSDFLVANTEGIANGIENNGWLVSRTMDLVNNSAYKDKITAAVRKFYVKVQQQSSKTPYGVPYEPSIWGAGWGIQNFGYKQYFLQANFPEIFTGDYMLNAINFVLGCHPGANTSSFASGVGAKSMTTAYGFNRADLSYIPGGITSGTALIRPDFPELLNWPYLWQQGEYVLGGGTSDYLFLVMAADHMLNKKN